ncbi:Uncharacterised protein [Mycobacteroides abscessus subsp. abscessus]|uniref:hypothetical protein n=1 Tax=Mycobacteroides abscessus TaxID=36809 RepID=UPI000926E6F0|nr:hypothetical protein [Mycobacteroides abscessus]SHU27466.1 Uncharacterised protein [Mycobacteroides abscessus subsp. abscessus]
MKSRRRPVQRRGLEDRAVDRLLGAGLARDLPETLETIGAIEMRVVADVANGLSAEQIAARYGGLAPEHVPGLHQTGLSRLIHPSRSQILRDYLDVDFAHYVAMGALLAQTEENTHCQRHGTKILVQGDLYCRGCSCENLQPLVRRHLHLSGRDRIYCSPECKQHGYRERQALKPQQLKLWR